MSEEPAGCRVDYGRQSIPLADLAAPILVASREGDIRYVNDAFCHVFRYQRKMITGQPYEHLVPEDMRDVHKEFVKAWFAEPRTRLMGHPDSRVTLIDGLRRERFVTIGLSLTAGDCVLAVISPRLAANGSNRIYMLLLLFVAAACIAVGVRFGLTELKYTGGCVVFLVLTRVAQDLGISTLWSRKQDRKNEGR